MSFIVLQLTLTEQQAHHTVLLGSFETSLQRLAAVPLHPSIKAAVQEYQTSALANSVASVNTTAGGVPGLQGLPGVGGTAAAPVEVNTLLDCIPVERERVYLAQCVANHKKVSVQLLPACLRTAALVDDCMCRGWFLSVL
jgi:hypothetical protein